MKFETINNQLCRMVEPTPLQLDSPMPCMVRYIQDCSPMGRYMKRKFAMVINTVAIVSRIGTDGRAYSSDKLFIEEVEVLEIIGYPVADGSAEWALWQMEQGNKVRNSDWDDGTYERSLLYCQLIGETIKYNEGCSAFDVCLSDWEAPYIKNTGWQIYEPKPESQYKVGDWVEHKESKEQATIRRIMSYGAIEIEFAYSTESDIYQANDFHNDFRKLSPSEVIVRIGCLSGTVTYAISDDCFLLAKVNDPQHRACCIDMSMLDAPTRELVKALLKAQEEEE